MKLSTIVKFATEFGTFRSRKHIFSFTLKCIFYIIPAVLLGNYTDVFVHKLKTGNYLGKPVISYLLLQTLLIILTFYIILLFSSDFMKEFQITLAGGYFIVLYFGIQTHYVPMIKEFLN